MPLKTQCQKNTHVSYQPVKQKIPFITIGQPHFSLRGVMKLAPVERGIIEVRITEPLRDKYAHY